MTNQAMSEPPEGVVRGESVPAGSEPDEYDRERIERVKNGLKTRGGQYLEMSDSELEDKAITIISKSCEDC